MIAVFLRSWCFCVWQMQCRLPVPQALPFLGCVPLLWAGLYSSACSSCATPSSCQATAFLHWLSVFMGKGELPQTTSVMIFIVSMAAIKTSAAESAQNLETCLSSNYLFEGIGKKQESCSLCLKTMAIELTACQAPKSRWFLLLSSFQFCRITWKCIWDSSSSWSRQGQVTTTAHYSSSLFV